jgi:hypothetical protein
MPLQGESGWGVRVPGVETPGSMPPRLRREERRVMRME